MNHVKNIMFLEKHNSFQFWEHMAKNHTSTCGLSSRLCFVEIPFIRKRSIKIFFPAVKIHMLNIFVLSVTGWTMNNRRTNWTSKSKQWSWELWLRHHSAILWKKSMKMVKLTEMFFFHGYKNSSFLLKSL